MTWGRIFVVVGAIALATAIGLLLFPSILGRAGGGDIPPTTDPVIINAVKGRQSGFREMGTAVKNIDESKSAGVRFDVELLADVHNIAANVDQMPYWFPPGSGPESGMKTRALGEIWKSRERFDRLAARLAREVKAFEQFAEQRQQKEFLDQFETVTVVCDECHKTYRREED